MRFSGSGHLLHSASFLICLTTLIITPKTFAQESGWPLDGPSFSASAVELTGAAGKVAKEKFTDVTVLFEEERYSLDAAGRVSETHRLIYRLETPGGVESWSKASVRWEPWYQTEPRIRARVIQSDGRMTELDQKTLTDVPANNEGNGTFEDARIHEAPLPALAVGAIVEWETVLVDKEPFFSGGEAYRYYFYRDVPVARARLVVETPLELPFQYQVKNMPDMAAQKEETGGVRRLTFDQSNLKPMGGSDINLSTHEQRYGRVEFSTGKSWKTVAAAYAALAEPQMQQVGVKNVALDNVAGHREAAIQTIVSAMHRDVRYTGLEFGQAKLTPQTPAEVMKRHYGDCKDKAALLVTMLRARGIPANLALLHTGPGVDVSAALPGMNQFDHAIVYVPADAKGNRELWIDATAEYTRVGDLPYADRDRLALIIADGTTELTRTPVLKAEDNVVVEKRTFTLKEFGPASVVEISETHGEAEADYRAWYGGVEGKNFKANLENYAKSAYLAKELSKFDRGDGKDFSKPFTLRLEMGEVKRGNTDLDEAGVAVSPVGVLNRLPKWFSTDPKAGQEKETADQKDEREKAEALRSSEYDVEPQVTEWRYEIVPAEGFALRALPEDKTTEMGPAKLTQHYSVDKAGVVTAVVRFETPKPRYTTEEAVALRKAVLEANQSNFILVMFDQTGAKLLAAGKMREALDADRALMEKHPNEALHHVEMANALLKAGVGDKARAEAMKATELEPKSALAYASLAWVLQHDSIGVRFGKGFDLVGARAAYKKAVELDPDNTDYRVNLGVLEEFDSAGDRYTAGADLPEAIRVYRALKEHNEAVGKQYEDNVLFDMLYAHEYKELLDEIASQPSTPVHDSVAISATVAKDGAAAGLRRADQISGGAQDRGTALRNAGNQLIQLRLYPQAAEILTAGLQGQENAPQTARQIEMFRSLKPAANDDILPPSDPREVVQRMMKVTMTGSLDEATLSDVLARHAFVDDASWKKNLKKSASAGGIMRVIAAKTGSAVTMLEDVVLGSMKLTQEGDETKGYRVSVQTIGAPAQHFFVTKEDGRYRIVASGNDMEEVGNEAIYLLRNGREEEARSLLDWKRDEVHKGGGDDLLEGVLLPRFWTSGETKGADAIEVAAASLLVGNPEIKELLPKVERARAAATTDAARGDLDLLLAWGYVRAGDGVQAKAASERLRKAYPDSITAIRVAGEAYGLNKDWAAWAAMLDARQAKHPNDNDVARERSAEARARGNFSDARKALQPLIDSGKAETNDFNEYGWLQLFDGTVDAVGVQAAQQANMLMKNESYAALHTLACLYAAQGKTTEARQLLLQAMSAGNMSEPNSAIWYGFGSIYEQYGVKDAAIAAYSKVEKPEGQINPVDTYVLAEARLKALRAN